MSEYDLVVRDGYLHGRDSVVDVGVRDGRIAAVGEVTGTADRELGADGGLVSPGLVDAHVHYDMAFSAGTGRRPDRNENPFDRSRNMARTAEYFAETPESTVADRVRRAIGTAVSNGVLHARAHTYVDGTVGTDVVETVLEACEALSDLIDVQVVAFPQQGYVRDQGSVAAAREAVRLGADLVGGIDPVGVNDDLDGTVEAWLDLATDLDVGLDVHLHDRGSPGTDVVERLAEAAVSRGHGGRVTASHAYALADANAGSGGRLDPALERAREAELAFVTCYMSTPAAMPVGRIGGEGLGLAHGTDQVGDLWSPHGNCDVLEGALVESLKLGYRSNPELRALWELITVESAAVLGLDSYGVTEGSPADLVVHGPPSPEWAVVRSRPPRYVLKRGRVVARDGALTGDAAVVVEDAG